MDTKNLRLKIIGSILICGLFILTITGNYNQVSSQTDSEETFLTEPTPTPDEAIVIIKKLLELFLQMPSGISSIPSTPSGSGSPPTQTPTFASLREIFNRIGAEIYVPPTVLEAVMLIETPATFNLTPQQISDYSTPNNVMPKDICGPNVCSATGPMQMTTGKDDKDNSLCPNCCWENVCLDTKSGCPNAWGQYGVGLPCNITDNVRAAAKKLKTDSQAISSTEWTQDEVNRAARRYYGDCTVSYARLGNRTYCGYVWWWYNCNKNNNCDKK